MSSREEYLEYLKQQLKYYCVEDEDGNFSYPIEYDYHYEFNPSDVRSIAADPDGYEMNVIENNLDYDSYMIDEIEKSFDDLDQSDSIYREYKKSEDFLADLFEAGYSGVDAALDELLDSQYVMINVLITTDNESNCECTTITAAYGNATEDPNRSADADTLDNGLTWLLEQQHYQSDDLYNAIDNGTNNDFLGYLVSQLEELPYSTAQVCFMASVPVNQAIAIIKGMENGTGTLHFTTDTLFCLIDAAYGAGGPDYWDRILEKPVDIPIDMISDIQIEGADDNSSYTVNEICGLIPECWKRNCLMIS